METTSPPLTPIRQYMSPLETSPRSPTSSYRDHLRRRTSSFSSNHDRSPTSVRSRNRFSNASQYSNDFSPDCGVCGMGNLADELDQLDDDDDGEDEDITDAGVEDGDKQLSPLDSARDSGIDVSYPSKRSPPQIKHFSRPFGIAQNTPPRNSEEQDRLSPELEDLISSIARMASYASTSEDPLIPRFVALLQDLGNQSSLEAGAQRLTTSTNSVTSHLIVQSKTLQALMTTLYSPFAVFSAPIDPLLIEDAVPLVEVLLKELPLPDPAPLQTLQKLDRETANLMQTLSQLTDTLQMGKHITTSAARHLRTTQTMVAELRRERERAETARYELSQSNWNDRIRDRRCAGECREIMSGFEQKCDALRESLVQGGSAVV